MASGRIGKSNLSAATDTTVYTTPASTFTVATVSICNRGNQAITVRLAVADAATPDSSEFVESIAAIKHSFVKQYSIKVLKI